MKLRSFLSRYLVPKRILSQMVLVLVVLVTLPLVILGFTLIQISDSALRTSVARDHQQIAVRAAGELQQFVRKPIDLLTLTALTLNTLNISAWEQETVIVELALSDSAFKRISILDLSLNETITSDLGTMLQDRSGEAVVLKALEGQAAMSRVRISEEHFPLMTYAVPIHRFGATRALARGRS